MARTRGSRNADYEVSRGALTRALWRPLLQPGGSQASFRELAVAAGVSPATLRHYFGTREGLVAAVMSSMHQEGLPHLIDAATSNRGPLRESLEWLLVSVIQAWKHFGVGPMHVLGIAAGLNEEKLGPAYVNELLEPTLQAVEARLARHIADGDLPRCDVRYAALGLLSPVLLALIHQVGLKGEKCRPLDIDAFAAEHLNRFLIAYGSPLKEKSAPPHEPLPRSE